MNDWVNFIGFSGIIAIAMIIWNAAYFKAKMDRNEEKIKELKEDLNLKMDNLNKKITNINKQVGRLTIKLSGIEIPKVKLRLTETNNEDI